MEERIERGNRNTRQRAEELIDSGIRKPETGLEVRLVLVAREKWTTDAIDEVCSLWGGKCELTTLYLYTVRLKTESPFAGDRGRGKLDLKLQNSITFTRFLFQIKNFFSLSRFL